MSSLSFWAMAVLGSGGERTAAGGVSGSRRGRADADSGGAGKPQANGVAGRGAGPGSAFAFGQKRGAEWGEEPPALLANAAEAVLAAMYLDAVRVGENPLDAIRALAERLLLAPDLPLLRDALRGAVGRGALRDPKTLLQERVQALECGPCALYRYGPERAGA